MEKTEKLKYFQNKIKEIYGSEVGSNVLKEIENKSSTSFRINNLKANKQEVLSELNKLGFKIIEGEILNSFYIAESSENLSLAKTKAFDEGKIYIQNISSMIPSLVLNPKPGEDILDLCAAPGSKTTHITALSDNKAKITAVENNVNRFNLLKDNCKNQGATNVLFIRASSQNLLNFYPQFTNFFDKVLCDVPCSNDGLIRAPDSYDFKYWNPKLPKKLSNLQKKLIASGINMLKNGGTLVYSTCTYSVEENEQVINWALKTFPEMEITEINLENIHIIPGIKAWKGKVFDKGIQKTARILPSNYYEAFFIAKLVKK
jgi:16S rRNA (cytosine1407-C5)-methyltransferase